MPALRGVDEFPSSVVDDWPADVRAAFRRRARAGAALRLYRRRGWNPSAVQFQFDRETTALNELLDKLAFEHENPPLF